MEYDTIILGLGKSGYSCIPRLIQLSSSLAIMDSRPEPPYLAPLKKNYPEIPVYLGKFDEAICAVSKQLVVSPGISLNEPAIVRARAQQIPVIGDIELFALAAKAPVIAITGSNGKSTVTTLVGEMAKNAGIKVAVGGNLGTPALELLADNIELYVLELSSFQLDLTYSLKPLAATILNLSPDHIDRHGSLEAYRSAKQRIYRHAENAIVTRLEPMLWENQHLTGKIVSFGFDRPEAGNFGLMTDHQQRYLAFGDQMIMPVSELKLFGEHQILNVLAAMALAHCYQISFETMRTTLKNFTGLPHRCQVVSTKNDITWINDSKATNMGAAIASIESIGKNIRGKVILIAGGQPKGADFHEMLPILSAYTKSVILIGEAKQQMQAIFSAVIDTHLADTFRDAVVAAKKIARAGDAILLAPACASFDMFKNFEDRGEQFVKLVTSIN